MSDPASVTTPEPVRWMIRIIAGLVLLLTQINPAAFYFGWWDISAAGLVYVSQLAGAATAFLLFVWGEQVRDKVMPMAKVEKVVDAALAEAPPNGIVGLTPAEQTRWNPGAD